MYSCSTVLDAIEALMSDWRAFQNFASSSWGVGISRSLHVLGSETAREASKFPAVLHAVY